MFVYLSKKIAIPNNIHLNCISWNQKQGYIALGGEEGLLKVIRTDSNSTLKDVIYCNDKNRSNTISNNLNMNQTLEGHNGHVQVVTWNEEQQKLTSSDQNGVIIVWMLYKGSWYEEMINNRNKSVVKGMVWNSDGQKICIVYEDGAVIVGSVEGNRIWGKELKGISLTKVQWSPDAKFLLFGTKNGEIYLYDDQGIFLTKLDYINSSNQPIIGLQWYDGRNGYITSDCPVLAICSQNGKLYLLRDINDSNPITVDTNMTIFCCAWNSAGSVLAICGMIINDKKDSNIVCFYSSFGKLMKILKVPGKNMSCCAWEAGSLRISLTVDSNIYFANIRPNYKWAYFSNTLVFTDEKVTKDGICIIFWNTVTNSQYFKYVRSLINIIAHGDHCLLAVKSNSDKNERFVIFVCNAISTPIDTKFIDFEPLLLGMNNSMVIIASRSNFLLWNFRTPRNSIFTSKYNKDKIYHIDDTPIGVTEVIQDLDRDRSFVSLTNKNETGDPICSVSISEKLLLISRKSGIIQQYSLPQVILTKRYATSYEACSIAINCHSTRAAIIDNQDVLRFLELKTHKIQETESNEKEEEVDISKFERKDTWTMCWAQDNPYLLATMEKSRMYIFRSLEPEEPISCSGYICSFKDLEIRCVLLDQLLLSPDNLRSELLLDLEVKSLRDTKELLTRVGLRETEEFIRDNSHPRLWQLLAEHALRKLNLDVAENAMVHCADYLGIRFVKQLRKVHEPTLRRAEILCFLGAYDEAEQIYLEIDRRDLAIALRQKLADYSRALRLMHLDVCASDVQVEGTHKHWGEQLAACQHWQEARKHLESGCDLNQLLDCLYRLEEYQQLITTAAQLPDQTNELRRAARMLYSIGMCQQAVTCLIRCADVRQAVETCVRLNQWDQALELARTWRLSGISELLTKYTRHLLDSGRRLQAIELYRKADCPLEAAKLLLKLATEQTQRNVSPIRLKKLYVLAALLVQEHLEGLTYEQTQSRTRSGLLMGLNESSGEDMRIIEEAWRGAEAYHFLLLAHRQLYAAKPEAAMRTTMRLRDYEDILDQKLIYSLLAIASCACGAFATSSRAFVRLEALDSRYEQLGFQIFGKRLPKDLKPASKSECLQCENLIPDYCVGCPNCAYSFPACIISGRPIINQISTWLCTICKHYAASERDVVNMNGCPLCHSIITYM